MVVRVYSAIDGKRECAATEPKGRKGQMKRQKHAKREEPLLGSCVLEWTCLTLLSNGNPDRRKKAHVTKVSARHLDFDF